MDEDRLLHKFVSRLKNNRHTIQELSEIFKKSETEISCLIDELIKGGASIDIRGDTYLLKESPEAGNVHYISGADNIIRELGIGIISDTHFGSKFHLSKTFHETMNVFEDEGIKVIYHSGDIIDGLKVYSGQLENLVSYSVEDQTDIAAEAFSKHKNLTFKAVCGNHDWSHTKLNGSKPLAIIEAKCDNFQNLGDMRADIIYHGIKIRLLHGAAGRSYARSYPSQTYLRDLFGGSDREDIKEMPHLLLLGHYHTLYVGKDHGMWIIQAGSFQDGDNEYCLRRGLTGANGGFMLKADYQSGELLDVAFKYIEPTIQKLEKGEIHAHQTRRY